MNQKQEVFVFYAKGRYNGREVSIMWMIYVLLALTALFFLITWVCFRMTFYMTDKQKRPKTEYDIPDGDIYEPYRDRMVDWIKQTRALPFREMTITSADGLRLVGKFYEYQEGAPIELMFPGYRGRAERDLCGGVQRCFSLGYSVLLVEQRACGVSDGHVITFGVKESDDCIRWARLLEQEYPDRPVMLTGVSMGAATVLTAAGKPLPKNVVAVLADCGYTSAKDIICKVLRDMKLPTKLVYPFIKWSARLYGGFSLEETAPIEAVKCSTVPILFIHGDADAYVPCEMSIRNYEACTADKQLFVVKGAGHGLSYLVDRDGYVQTLKAFREQYMKKTVS